jgi:uncharacterized delta-60 repeat protein
MKQLLLIGLFSVVYLSNYAQNAGNLDNSFLNTGGANGNVLAVVVQPDGKILLGGEFTSYNGVSRNRIARLNRDGNLDTSFNPGSGIGGFVRYITLQPDGKILLAGRFSVFNGVNRNGIVRLNSDGSLDNSFNPGSGSLSQMNAIALQTDGKILLGGVFTSFNGVSQNHIVRLNSDGSLDTSFKIGSGADDGVWSIAIQPDGKILLGGDFGIFNGVSRNGITRLNTDGSLDNTFDAGNGATGIYAIALRPDNKIILGGGFLGFNGLNRSGIVQLNTDGSLDNTFNTGTGLTGGAFSIGLQPDGKILLGGYFPFYDGNNRNNIVRLNSNGSFDNTLFNRDGSLVLEGEANDWVVSLAVQTDGKIVLGGRFTRFNNVNFNRITRIYGSVPSVPTPNSPSQITNTSFQLDWASILGVSQYEVDISSNNFVTFISGYKNYLVSGTSLIISNLNPGTKYQCRVRALNEQGASPNSITINTITLPNNPTTLQASLLGQTGFTANWEAVLGASSYLLDVSEKADFSSFLAGYQNRDLSLTSEELSGLNPNTKYYYRVRAINISGQSGYSNVISVTTLPNTPIANAPSEVNTSGFTANWKSLGTNNNIKYLLEVSNDNFITLLPNFQNPITAITLIINGLTEGTIYQYRVRAVNDGGVSPYSNPIQVGTLLNSPINLAISELGLNKISITWEDKSNMETGYEIQRSNFSGTGYFTLTITNSGVTNYTDLAVLPNTQYFYRVRAVKNSDNLFSTFSNIVNATTPQDPSLIAPNAPSLVQAQAISINQINLSWQDNSANENSFVIESSVGNPNNFQVIASVSANTTTYNHSGLTAATTYFYRVRAFSNGGGSAYSAVIGGTTIDDNIVTADENALHQGIKIFPNPSQTNLHIRRENTHLSTIKFRLLNQLGVLILEGYVENNVDKMLDLSMHQAGIYFLELSTNKHSIIKKIIKQ